MSQKILDSFSLASFGFGCVFDGPGIISEGPGGDVSDGPNGSGLETPGGTLYDDPGDVGLYGGPVGCI